MGACLAADRGAASGRPGLDLEHARGDDADFVGVGFAGDEYVQVRARELNRTFADDLALWHREELGLVSDLMDRNELDEVAFSRICLLKRKTRGWFLGVDKGEPALTPYTAGGSE
ncbi:MAG: hypothetical protein ACYTKD_04565 [Planctomycetota bacterium]|jgi:hypothetical protein